MGVFIPSNWEQELDPRWQKRRQRIFALIGFLGLAAAMAVVWYLSPLRDDSGATREPLPFELVPQYDEEP